MVKFSRRPLTFALVLLGVFALTSCATIFNRWGNVDILAATIDYKSVGVVTSETYGGDGVDSEPRLVISYDGHEAFDLLIPLVREAMGNPDLCEMKEDYLFECRGTELSKSMQVAKNGNSTELKIEAMPS
jgi:hypothetical protein